MVIGDPVDLTIDYERSRFDAAGLQCDLFVSKTGREPVILLHELPAITPEVAHLAAVLNKAGYRVYMPSLLGRPGAVPNLGDTFPAPRPPASGAISWRSKGAIIPGRRWLDCGFWRSRRPPKRPARRWG